VFGTAGTINSTVVAFSAPLVVNKPDALCSIFN
jgi:hypothetical protein